MAASASDSHSYDAAPELLEDMTRRDFAIRRFSTWQSIASYAVVTLSPSRSMMLPPTAMRLNEPWYARKRQADRCASS
jgi:hypothetical protein